MRFSRWVVVACLWLLCVGAVGGGAWYAIDSAGRQVAVLAGSRDADDTPVAAPSQDDGSDTPSEGPTTPTDDGPTTPAGAGTTSSRGGTPSTSTTTPPPGRAPSTRPSQQEPDDTRTTTSPRSPRTTAPEPSRTSSTTTSTTTTSSSPSASRTRTASTDGGTVVVVCRIGAPMDYVVNPAQGWSADDHTSGAQEVSVKLRRRDRTIEVHATCVDGTPEIKVDESTVEDD